MELFETIARRHSYRGPFTGEAVPTEDLKRIVEAGLQAPSGCNAQTTTFVIVNDDDTLAAIADILGKPSIKDAGGIIATVMEERAVYQGMSFGVEDYACAVENMLLAITALGYATGWIDGALRCEKRAARIGDLLSVPPHLQVRVMLPIGRPAETCQQKEKGPFEQRAWFNTYGAR